MQPLIGTHHVTAITSSAEKIYEFFTHVLGVRLVKKTVNQDDIQTYHLFFADDEGNAGTDMTFFDFPGIPKGTHGTNAIDATSFRVPSNLALEYWKKRFERLNIIHEEIETFFGRSILKFQDFDEQRYFLISDEKNEGVPSGVPWKKGPIPEAFAITGLGPVYVKVSHYDGFHQLLTHVLQMEKVATSEHINWYEMGEGGNGAALIVEWDEASLPARQGFGTVHHAAFRVKDRAHLEQWIERLNQYQIPNSNYVDRFFFESLYARVASGVLFEWATDGPGFMGDEPYETLGEKLSLPPFLESKRTQIESIVRPIDTTRSTRQFEKEYEGMDK